MKKYTEHWVSWRDTFYFMWLGIYYFFKNKFKRN